MIKIFYYELKKLLFNRFFAALTALTLWYGYQILKGDVLLGIANTAPFSPWSFGFYLSSLLPLLAAILLFFIAFLSSKQEILTRALTDSSPAPSGWYRFVRCAAIFVGVFLMTTACFLMGFLFLGCLFRFENLSAGKWVGPSALVLFPSLIFVAGLGVMAGNWKSWAVYGLIGGVFLAGVVTVPDCLALIPTAFFGDYPKSLGELEPNFSVPVPMIVSRTVYCVLGILMMIAGLKKRVARK